MSAVDKKTSLDWDALQADLDKRTDASGKQMADSAKAVCTTALPVVQAASERGLRTASRHLGAPEAASFVLDPAAKGAAEVSVKIGKEVTDKGIDASAYVSTTSVKTSATGSIRVAKRVTS